MSDTTTATMDVAVDDQGGVTMGHNIAMDFTDFQGIDASGNPP